MPPMISGLRQRQKVVVALEVAGAIAEALAAVAALIQPVLLDHRSHGAVQQHDALAEQLLQAFQALAARGLIRRLERERRGGHPRARIRTPLGFAVGARRVRARRGMAASAHAGTPLRAGRGCAGRRPSA